MIKPRFLFWIVGIISFSSPIILILYVFMFQLRTPPATVVDSDCPLCPIIEREVVVIQPQQQQQQKEEDSQILTARQEVDEECLKTYLNSTLVHSKSTKLKLSLEPNRILSVNLLEERHIKFFWVTHDDVIVKWLSRAEAHVRDFFHTYLKNGTLCDASAAASNTSLPVVLDIGANSGFYGLLAAAMGCRVIFFEPQPYCTWMIEQSIVANGWTTNKRLSIVRGAVGDDNPDSRFKSPKFPVWCNSPCIGTMGKPGTKYFKQKPDGWRSVIQISNSSINKLMPAADMILAKVDTEGAEAAVLRGMRPLFKQRRIKAAIVEVTPQFYKRRNMEVDLRQKIYEEFLYIVLQGYSFHRPNSGRPINMKGYRALNQEEMKKYLLRASFIQHDVIVIREDQ